MKIKTKKEQRDIDILEKEVKEFWNNDRRHIHSPKYEKTKQKQFNELVNELIIACIDNGAGNPYC